MKDNKDKKIEMRVTAEEKAYLKEYAENHNMTLSELIRMALDRIIYIEQI